MIENEKQYEVSKKTLSEVVEKINQMKSNSEDDSLATKLIQMSIEEFKDQIEKEIEYEALKSSETT